MSDIETSTERYIEIRCPVGPKRLFMIMRMNGEKPRITEWNLIEVSCQDCARTLRKQGHKIFRVLHRFDLAGELIETAVIDVDPDLA